MIHLIASSNNNNCKDSFNLVLNVECIEDSYNILVSHLPEDWSVTKEFTLVSPSGLIYKLEVVSENIDFIEFNIEACI